jgi:murein L,D-transpeptidase YafK
MVIFFFLYRISLIFSVLGYQQGSFKSTQMSYARVSEAYSSAWPGLKKELESAGFKPGTIQILFAAYKSEQVFEVHIRQNSGEKYKLFKTYAVCQSSGGPGPKRKQGDGQVPNYPNTSDKYFAGRDNPGGDIFIHGKCVTIGCLPLTDEKIKEVYVLAVEARNGGQNNIPVLLFPCKMEGDVYAALRKKYSADKELLNFWDNLETGYKKFVSTGINPAFSFDAQGKYVFK